MTDSVILTGGYHSPSRVQEYNLHGSVARLPDLNTGRRHHACGHYVHNGQMVSKAAAPTMQQLTVFILSAGIYCQRRKGWI